MVAAKAKGHVDSIGFIANAEALAYLEATAKTQLYAKATSVFEGPLYCTG